MNNYNTFQAMLIVASVVGASYYTSPKSHAVPIEIATVKHIGNVDFEKQILPLLRRNCLACHNSSDAEGDLVLETPQTILKGGSEGPAVVAGKSADSLLLTLASHQDDPVMPPDDNDVGAKNFSPEELGLIKLWVDQGAKGEVLGTAAPVKWQPLAAAVKAINAVAITDDAQYAATGRGNGVFLYHVPSKREIGRLADETLKTGDNRLGAAHQDVVQSLAFSPHGGRLATGGYRVVKIWKRPKDVRIGEIASISNATSCATSPDGKWAAVGQSDGKLQLVYLASRKLVHTLSGHSGAIAGVVFSADSKTLASGSKDKTCRLWNVAEGKQTLSIETPSEVNAVALVAGGKQIATAGADNVIRTWAIESAEAGGAEKVLPTKEMKGHSGPVTSLAVISQGTQLLSGSQDSSVRVWDVGGGNQIRTMSHGTPITSVAVRPDGKRFASASGEGFAKLWDAANGQQIAELKGDITARVLSDAAARNLALAKSMVDLAKSDLEESNKRKKSEQDNAKKAAETLKKAEGDLATKSQAAKKPEADLAAAKKKFEETLAKRAEAEEARKVAEAARNDAQGSQKAASEILAKAMSDQEKKDATAKKKEADENLKRASDAFKAADSDFRKADAAHNKAKSDHSKIVNASRKPLDERDAAKLALDAAKRSVDQAAISLKKATEAVPVAEALVKSREQSLGECEQEVATASEALKVAEKPLVGVAFSRDNGLLATVGLAQRVQTWDAQSGGPIETFKASAPLKFVAFDASGDILTVGPNSAILWDSLADWQLDRTIGSPDSSEAFSDRVTALAFSGDGKLLATGSGVPSRSGELKIWNAEDGSLVHEVKEPHSDTIYSLEFTRDASHIASGAADRFVKVFDVATGTLAKSFEGHTHHVLGVAWSANGRTLVSAGADKVIKVWQYQTGEQKRTITGFGKAVTGVRFVGTSGNVVASCGDRNVYIKRADNGGSVRTLAGSTDFVNAVAVSDDGKFFAAGGQDSVLRIWNENGQAFANFVAPAPKATQTAEK